MPIGDRKSRQREIIKASAKDVKQEEQESRSNVDIILDLLGRPSRAVAGLGKEVIDVAQGKEFNPIDAVFGNITGDRQDQWSKNINQATGIPEDSWTARGLGFVGDAVADPFNFVNPAAPVIRAVRPIAQGIQAAAKAGKYGGVAQDAAKLAKGARGLVSNYAGLVPEEQAITQLYDAKLHSFDDLVKETFINRVKDIDNKVASIPDEMKRSAVRGTLIGKAVADAKLDYKNMVEAAQAEMVSKAGQNVSPDMAEHLTRRTKDAWKQSPVDQMLGNLQENYSAVMAPDRIWKKTATRYNPLFYSNNMMGNIQQTLQEATKSDDFINRNFFSGTADTLGQYARQYARKAGIDVGSGVKGFTPDDLERLGRDRGVKTNISSLYKGQEVKSKKLDATLNEIASVYGNSGKGAFGQLRDKVSRGLDWAQQAVEGDSRQAAFNTYFKQEIAKGIPAKEAADNAALRVTQSLFDYEDVTDAVKLARSAPIINAPFATWAVKNTPRQAAFVAKNPAYAAKWDAATRIGEGEGEADTPIPGYMRERIAIPLGKVGDDKNLFFKPAATISDLNNIPFSLGSMRPSGTPLFEAAGPTTKILLDAFANRDSFTGRQIAAEGTPYLDRFAAPQNVPSDMQWLLENVPELGNMLGGSRSRYTNKPQLPYIVNEVSEAFPAPRNLLRAMHTLFDNENASDKLPLGQFIPFDVKSDKQIEVSKQLENREVVKRANAKARNKANSRKSLPESERLRRLIQDDYD